MFGNNSFSGWWYGNDNKNKDTSSPLIKNDTQTKSQKKTSSDEQLETFDAFEYHYSKSLSNLKHSNITTHDCKDNIIVSCTPMKVSFSDLKLKNDIDNKNIIDDELTSKLKNINLTNKNNNNNNKNNNDNEKNHNNDKNDKDDKDDSKSNEFDDFPPKIYDNESYIMRYLNTLDLKTKEKNELIRFHAWVSQDNLSMKMSEELMLGDMIMSYFSSFSPTNPDIKGCWKRWIQYKKDNPLKDVNFNKVKEFFKTNFFSIGWTKTNTPIWIVNSQYYDSKFGPEVTAKAMLLWVTSILWDLTKNEFDFHALRNGILIYADLSHFGVNMLQWSVLKACKSAIVAFPWQSTVMYCANPPTLIYLLRQIASQILLPHAMKKIKMVANRDEFFEKYNADPERCPVEIGGKSKLTSLEWMKSRGYIEDIKN